MHFHIVANLHFTVLTLCLLGLKKKKKTFFLSNCRNQPQEKSDYKEVTRVAGIWKLHVPMHGGEEKQSRCRVNALKCNTASRINLAGKKQL